MTRISAVVITYNEEKKIERCIRSLQKVADEIIVVDSFSSDGTIEISTRLGAKNFQHIFEGYIEQKNYAIALASNTFVLSLDADEILSDELISSISKIKNNPLQADGYTMNRLNNYCGKWIRHCGWYPDKKLRLIDKTKGKWGGVNPHDKFIINPGTTLKHITGDILHYSYDSVEAHIEQQKRFAEISAQHMHKLNKCSTFFHVYLKPPIKFLRDYIFHLGFLDGYYGFIISKISASAMYRKYARLRELQRSS
jgi:glycosyltransferase involved in cell wall biosynthesis